MNDEPLKLDRLNWIADNLKIITKSGELVNLYPNIGQMMLHNSMEVQRSRGVPVKICLLKPRQVGWSTWSVADTFCDVVNRHNLSAIVVSADDDATDSIFKMARLMNEELPYKMPTEFSNRKEIVFGSPHRSRIIAQTAGKMVLGRGSTYKRVHCSEVAFWRNAAQQLGGLYQVVPNEPDTAIVLESTANGIGGAFYNTFWQAVERIKSNKEDINGFLPVFFPWYKFPEYSMPIPSGVLFEAKDEEKDLQVKYSLSDEQLYWRRMKIVELNGDGDLFRQEYPSTAKEAFLTSGRPVFPMAWVDKQVTGPGRLCLFDAMGSVEGNPKILDIDRHIECWRIWKTPRESDQYSIGVDTMEGRLSDMNNPRSKSDFHGVAVFDRTTGEVVAQYYGRCSQQDLAEQVYIAANWYNLAWVGIELPNGKTVLDYFRSKMYPNLYRRQTHDLQDTEQDTDDYGWRTTTITRPWLIDGLVGVIRDNAIRIYSQNMLDEMRTFARDRTGKPIHLPGEHDDLLFGLMIAIQVHLRCPLNPMQYSFGKTGVGMKHSVGAGSSLNMMNAIDDMSDILGIEEDASYTA